MDIFDEQYRNFLLRLKDVIKRLDKTQGKIAIACGISQSYLSEIFNGKTKANIELLFGLLKRT
jgi:transcriptional regulator with XRE-family HTH domain